MEEKELHQLFIDGFHDFQNSLKVVKKADGDACNFEKAQQMHNQEFKRKESLYNGRAETLAIKHEKLENKYEKLEQENQELRRQLAQALSN